MRSGFRITRRAAFIGVAAGGALGVPAVLRAQGPVRLTLGHGQSPGNPRTGATVKNHYPKGLRRPVA